MVFIVSADLRPGKQGYSKHFRARVDHSRIINHDKLKNISTPHMHVVGLALVAPGKTCIGLRTPWNDEEDFLWSLHDYASDSMSIQVLECARCILPRKVEPFKVTQHNYGYSHILFHSLNRRAGTELLSSDFQMVDSKRKITGFELAHKWSVEKPLERLCMVVPQTIASSMLLGLLKHQCSNPVHGAAEKVRRLCFNQAHGHH